MSDRWAKEDYVDTGLAGKVPTTRTVNGHALSADVTVTKSDVSLGNVDNTSDATKNAAAATLTNKSIDASQLTGTVALARLPTGTASSNVVVGGVITGAGPTGDASHTLALTYNAAGQLTAVTNNAIAIPESAVTGLVSDLALKAPLASPALTGSPTAPTQTALDSSTKIATTSYVDSAVTSALSGLDVKPDVAYAATSALPACTYANGSSGVGATLTGNANGPLLVDGVTILLAQAGSRVLVAAQAAPAQNGWYTITQVGVVAVSPFILTRATESDQAAEIGAGYLTGVVAPNGVTAGSNNGKLYISVAADPFVVGTTSLTFSQVGGTYTNGTGISLSGSTFSIDTSVTVDKTTAQTLTNKTLTSPVINTPTGIVKGDVGLGNVDNTSDATKNAASVTLTNKTLTSPVLNTGVSGTAIDTDSTMAANSDTILASQKATKTALALKAPLASPTFSGTVTSGGDLIADTTLTVGANAVPAGLGTGGALLNSIGASAGSAFHGVTIATELTYVGTCLSNASTIDLRRVNASYADFASSNTAGWTAIATNQHLGGMHIGANTPTLLLDCATFWCVADGNFADGTPADSAHANTPTRWEFYTTPASSSARTQTLALTIGSDQSLTVAKQLTIGGALSGVTTLSMAGALSGVVALTATGAFTQGSTGQLVSDASGNLTTSGIIAASVDSASALVTGHLRAKRSRASGAINNADLIGAFDFQAHDGTAYGTGPQILAQSTQAWTASAHGSKLVFDVVANGATAASVALTLGQDQSATFTNAVLSTDPTAGIGYATGAGGTVTQATNKSTGVTLNTACGKITMNNAALANATNAGFTLTNSAIAATDMVAVAIASGGTTNSYTVTVDAIAAGSCHITLRNISGGSLSEAVVITFAVVKAVTS